MKSLTRSDLERLGRWGLPDDGRDELVGIVLSMARGRHPQTGRRISCREQIRACETLFRLRPPEALELLPRAVLELVEGHDLDSGQAFAVQDRTRLRAVRLLERMRAENDDADERLDDLRARVVAVVQRREAAGEGGVVTELTPEAQTEATAEGVRRAHRKWLDQRYTAPMTIAQFAIGSGWAMHLPPIPWQTSMASSSSHGSRSACQQASRWTRMCSTVDCSRL